MHDIVFSSSTHKACGVELGEFDIFLLDKYMLAATSLLVTA